MCQSLPSPSPSFPLADVEPLAVARAELPASNLDFAVFAVAEERGAVHGTYEDLAVDAAV